ncbi:unnamed protein product, partial [Amoebophrya sp. A25]
TTLSSWTSNPPGSKRPSLELETEIQTQAKRKRLVAALSQALEIEESPRKREHPLSLSQLQPEQDPWSKTESDELQDLDEASSEKGGRICAAFWGRPACHHTPYWRIRCFQCGEAIPPPCCDWVLNRHEPAIEVDNKLRSLSKSTAAAQGRQQNLLERKADQQQSSSELSRSGTEDDKNQLDADIASKDDQRRGSAGGGSATRKNMPKAP